MKIQRTPGLAALFVRVGAAIRRSSSLVLAGVLILSLVTVGRLGALGALVALDEPLSAQARAPQAGMASLVGTWMVHLTDHQGNKRVGLTSLTKDGLVVSAGSFPLEAPPRAAPGQATIGQGVWAAAGNGFDFSFVELNVGADGSFVGTTTVTAHDIPDANGESWHGQLCPERDGAWEGRLHERRDGAGDARPLARDTLAKVTGQGQ